MTINLFPGDIPGGLTRRAQYFLAVHCVRMDPVGIGSYRDRWLAHGVPAREIDRAAEYSARWGGLLLPPSRQFEGGPKVLDTDLPEGSAEEGWWITVGFPRCSVNFGFFIGPDGAFGVDGIRWTPLHATVEGWIESQALDQHATRWAKRVTTLSGDEADDFDLTGFERVPEVVGLADDWWRGPDSLVAVHRGEAEYFGEPRYRTAYVYSGLPAHALRD
ncbi:hypothetical protein [Streptomyces sp. NBC_01264]|uniref:hypothetical protein n=1 Tax=Streptomyces sp. NBC_01264 TaxID=2903804 RepID=UPI0022523B25|nr:hypothetical protein [Streptomyces sp. NBC_01264]MCX4777038.1 hypothetical protein [Streptomyces sp. NBC_01264]